MKQKHIRTALLIAVLFFGMLEKQNVVFAAEEIETSAKAAILIEAVTGEVLYEKNSTERLPMASTTKIMTTLLCLESGDLDREFVVDADAIQVEGSSMGLTVGDIVTKRTLCYGMLLPSGNDAAGAVAVELAGSETGFAVLMNKKARSLGMTDTNFVTASGLHDEAHYSTAYDMAVLTVAALQNQDFREICSQSKAQVSFGNPPYDRWLWNSNRLLTMEDTILGVKTGYTDEAGRCLVSACVRDGVTLICVTLNDPNDWQDHLALYEEGFARVTPVTVELPDALMAEVSGGAKEMVSLSPTGRIIAGITGETVPTLVYQTTLNAYPLTAPLAEGECVGSWTGYYQGRAVATGTLCTGEAVLQQSTERETEKPHSSKWKRLWKTIKEAFCAISCTGRLRIRS